MVLLRVSRVQVWGLLWPTRKLLACAWQLLEKDGGVLDARPSLSSMADDVPLLCLRAHAPLSHTSYVDPFPCPLSPLHLPRVLCPGRLPTAPHVPCILPAHPTTTYAAQHPPTRAPGPPSPPPPSAPSLCPPPTHLTCPLPRDNR
jgi:hypothetical protein